jgi:hypothetical protein
MTQHLRLLIAAVVLSVCALARADIAVIEYYHTGFDHYFVTGIPDEIAKLDNGTFAGWVRTGKQFNAYASGTVGTAATCRFFSTSFGPKSSHFYTSSASECATVKANPDWQFEGEVFNVALPAADGSCPSPTLPVYRLYNNGQGGAPNHRFVTSLADRQAMLDKGYVAEGAGIGVGMCTPPDFPRQTAEGFWRGVTSQGQPVRIVVLDNRKFYVVYLNGSEEVGVLAGSFTYSGNTLASADAVQIMFADALKGFDSSVSGTFTPGSFLQLDFGASTVMATYDPSYDGAASLATLAGTYAGVSGHDGEFKPNGSTRATIGTDGSITIVGPQCSFRGKVAARGGTNLYDAALDGSGNCAVLRRGLHAILTLDSAARRISVLTDIYINPYLFSSDVYGMFGSN